MSVEAPNSATACFVAGRSMRSIRAPNAASTTPRTATTVATVLWATMWASSPGWSSTGWPRTWAKSQATAPRATTRPTRTSSSPRRFRSVVPGPPNPGVAPASHYISFCQISENRSLPAGPSARPPDDVLPDELPKHPRHRHGPVRVLAVLEDRDERPRRRHGGAVQRVREPLLPARLPHADPEAARLEVDRVRARRDLAVRVLAGEPCLQVVPPVGFSMTGRPSPAAAREPPAVPRVVHEVEAHDVTMNDGVEGAVEERKVHAV